MAIFFIILNYALINNQQTFIYKVTIFYLEFVFSPVFVCA